VLVRDAMRLRPATVVLLLAMVPIAALGTGCSAAADDESAESEDIDIDESGVGSAPVSVTFEDGNVIGVKNGDGEFWIAKRCLGVSHFGDRKTTGPGYVYRLAAPIHGGSKNVLVVDDQGGDTLPWGGLLSFAYHHTRGAPPYDLVYGWDLAENPAGNSWSVSTRICADDGGNGFGVARSTVIEGPTKYGGGANDPLYWSIAVDLRTPWTDPIIGIVYRYQFHSSVVKVWTRLTTHCSGPTCGDPEGMHHFVKEPKFTTRVVKGAYDQFASLDNEDNVLAKYGLINPVKKTHQMANPARARIRYGFASSPCNGSHRCLSIKARGYPAGQEPGGPTFRWEGAGFGLDRWAVLASKDPQSPRGTDSPAGVGNAQPWPCHGGDPAADLMRRWEAGGQNEPSAPIGPNAAFHGWEGGASVDDCEPLYRHFPAAGSEFANYFSINLHP
jgi:hypothetical protein